MREFVQKLNGALGALQERNDRSIGYGGEAFDEVRKIPLVQDGQGRMCRIILDALLCEFAGVVVPIGEDKENRDA